MASIGNLETVITEEEDVVVVGAREVEVVGEEGILVFKRVGADVEVMDSDVIAVTSND